MIMNSTTAVTKPPQMPSGPVVLVKRAAINEPVHRLQPVYQFRDKCFPSVSATSNHPCADPLPAPRTEQRPPFQSISRSQTIIPSRSSIPASSSASSSSCRKEFNPGDFFAKQSMRCSQMAGKGKTWVRFRRDNMPIGDLLLADHSNVEIEIIERGAEGNAEVAQKAENPPQLTMVHQE